MKIQETVSWTDLTSKLGGDDLTQVLGHPLFGMAFEAAADFLDVLVDANVASLDEEQALVTVDDDRLVRLAATMISSTPDDPSLDEAMATYLVENVARLIESMRLRLLWHDLSAQERALIEPAFLGHLVRHQKKLSQRGTSALPQADQPVDSLLRFIVWWSRNDGKLPDWLLKATAD